MKFRIFCLGILGFFVGTACALAADGTLQLQQFIDRINVGQGRFTQISLTKQDGKVKKSQGSFSFERPGKFRWVYEQPYKQILVGDGVRLWIYDPELKQVSVKPAAKILDGTPAMFLVGARDLKQNFILEEDPSEGDISWVRAKPKKDNAGFESLRLGLRAGMLVRLEIEDSFGVSTRITVEEFNLNPELDKNIFKFTPPPGVDVLEAF